MMDAVLKVNGVNYGGWTSIEVQRSVDHLAGDFTFTAVELWSGASVLRPIPPGAACSVSLGGKTVITGYVDAVDVAYDDKQHQITVTGRDAAADLVDCSAVHAGGSWYGQTMDKIVADLIAPHNVMLSVTADVGKPFATWQITGGETILENIDRMARQRGVLVVSDGLGGIRLAQPSTSQVRTALVLGKNIKSAQGTNDIKQRFYQYVALGQAELLNPSTYSQCVGGRGEAVDTQIRKNRLLIVAAEEGFDIDTFTRRATWEANTRFGRGLNISYEVTGWSHADGLWEPDRMVHVDDNFMGIHDWLYISSVTYKLGDGGTTATLGLTHREAFELIPIPAKGQLDA